MLEKDEVSKYTVPKNALDMLEWPPNTQKYTAKDIPELIKKSFKPMTDSNAVPNPVPGTEVTQSPGLIPETTTQIPGYDPNTSTAPTEYDPASANVDTAVPTTDYADAVDHLVDSMPQTEADHHPEMPVYTETETAHQELMQDPQYAIATHEHTLNKFADLLEQIVGRLNAIEEKLDNHITDVTGPDPNDPLAAYPEVQRPGLTK